MCSLARPENRSSRVELKIFEGYLWAKENHIGLKKEVSQQEEKNMIDIEVSFESF